MGQSLDTPTLPFLQNFSSACVRMDPVNVSVNLQSVALAVPEIIVIAVLGWGCEPPNLREGEAVGSRGWHYSKERW